MFRPRIADTTFNPFSVYNRDSEDKMLHHAYQVLFLSARAYNIQSGCKRGGGGGGARGGGGEAGKRQT